MKLKKMKRKLNDRLAGYYGQGGKKDLSKEQGYKKPGSNKK